MGNIRYDFSGKNALVTGATKGIGREIVLMLAEAGCGIAATGRNEEELASLQEEVQKIGPHCVTKSAELASAEETAAMAEYLAKELHPIDILINNAGTSISEEVINLEVEHWDEILNVNLRAPAIISKIVAAGMIIRKKGAIVNISSNAGTAGVATYAAYVASKFGLNGLTKVMALELAPYNIRVNVISPCVTLTPMGDKYWSDPEKKGPMLAKIPNGRFAYPREIASAALFLASDEAAMIQGEVLLVDGGMNAGI